MPGSYKDNGGNEEVNNCMPISSSVGGIGEGENVVVTVYFHANHFIITVLFINGEIFQVLRNREFCCHHWPITIAIEKFNSNSVVIKINLLANILFSQTNLFLLAGGCVHYCCKLFVLKNFLTFFVLLWISSLKTSEDDEKQG